MGFWIEFYGFFGAYTMYAPTNPINLQLHHCRGDSFAFDGYGNAFCTFGDADDGLGAAVPSVVGVVAGIGTIAEVAGAEGEKYADFYINGDFVLRHCAR